MDMFEEAVLRYVTAPGDRFVCPQFEIPYDAESRTGGTCPDFLVLDFRNKKVYVVEVTSAADTKKVMAWVRDRESRWKAPLRSYLTELHPMLTSWPIRLTIFVREEEKQRAQTALSAHDDLSVLSLTDVVFSWGWKWHGQRPENPLE